MGAASCKCGPEKPPPDYNQLVTETYPMWLMRMPHVLSLTSLEPHEAHREVNSLVQYQEGMVVIFVSHQWVGLTRPDDKMTQFKDLQRVLNGLINKASKVLV